jgi:hypothetical protein
MKNLGRALDLLAENIQSGHSAEDCFVDPNFPRFLYKTAANMHWRIQAIKNGLKIRELYKK